MANRRGTEIRGLVHHLLPTSKLTRIEWHKGEIPLAYVHKTPLAERVHLRCLNLDAET